MNIILFDDPSIRDQLLPLTFLRPISEMRIGLLSIAEKWKRYLSNSTLSYLVPKYLQEKYPCRLSKSNLFINAGLLPHEDFLSSLYHLRPTEAIKRGNTLLAASLNHDQAQAFHPSDMFPLVKEYQGDIFMVKELSDIFMLNRYAINLDYKLLTKSRSSAPLSKTNFIQGTDIFIESGAQAEFAYLNASTGPIYLGKGVQIMEGAMIRGPFAAGENAVVKMGAKIYGATSLGPETVIGGEVKNSVFFGYSNKGHEGYLGDSVIAQWCNLGAGTTVSNVKNTFGSIKTWRYSKSEFINTGLNKYGVIMGDHVKCGINTTLNTGTIIGIGCSLAKTDLMPKFIPDFSFSVQNETEEQDFEKACISFERMMDTKKGVWDEREKHILQTIYNLTDLQRQNY